MGTASFRVVSEMVPFLTAVEEEEGGDFSVKGTRIRNGGVKKPSSTDGGAAVDGDGDDGSLVPYDPRPPPPPRLAGGDFSSLTPRPSVADLAAFALTAAERETERG